MLGAWPEPFGLVAIESMATGTPVIARRAGGPTETVEHHVTGFLVDDLTEAELAVRHIADLSRATVRARVIERFLPARMVDEYEVVYRRLLTRRSEQGDAQRSRSATAASEEANGSGTSAVPDAVESPSPRPAIVALPVATRTATGTRS
jgi:hypothetical protein